MPGKRPRPSLCASVKPQMGPTCCYESSPASSSSSSMEAAKCELGVPQRVVFGFDVGDTSAKESSSNSGFVQTCRSPRSVLETDALSDGDHPPARSLRSVLDRLLSRPLRPAPPKVAICASSIAPIRVEETPPRAPELSDIVMRESPAAIAKQIVAVSDRDGLLSHEMLTPSPNRRFRGSVLEDGFSIPGVSKVKKKEQLPAPVQASIFSTPSPFSHFHSQLSTGDFLSLCFGCKCSLLPGKDIFMYRGDKAFCSSECRHQQIVVDEQKERQSSSTRDLSAHAADDSRFSIAAVPRRWL